MVEEFDLVNMQNKNKKNSFLFFSTKSCQLSIEDGFALIELVISLAMVGIVTAAVLQIARFSDTHKSLTLATDEFRAAIRTAQNSALSIPNPEKKHVCGYGIYIVSATLYELFYTYAVPNDFKDDPNICKNNSSYRTHSATTDGTTRETVQSFSLSTELKFNSGVGESLFFIVPYGDVFDNNGDELPAEQTYTIEKTDGSASRSIKINKFGRIQ